MTFHFFKGTFFAILLVSMPACFSKKPTENYKKLNNQESNLVKLNPNTKEDFSSCKHTYLLPINATKGAGQNVYIEISQPEKFRPLTESDQKGLYCPITTASKRTRFAPTFIHCNDNNNDPSRIITIDSYIGYCLSSQHIISALKEFIKSTVTAAKIIKDETTIESTYTKINLITSYYTSENRREMTYAEYYSGPFDCTGFMYSIYLSNEITEEQALKEIHEFVKNNIKLITL